jgi:hypothetical protein
MTVHGGGLVEQVIALPDRVRERVSAIRIELAGPYPHAVFSVALYGPAGWMGLLPDEPDPAGYAIAVDDTALPSGVSMTGWSRQPDVLRVLAGVPPTVEAIEDQIRRLDASGLLGRLDAVRIQPRSAGPDCSGLHWLVVTHAASQAERDAWLKARLAAGAAAS